MRKRKNVGVLSIDYFFNDILKKLHSVANVVFIINTLANLISFENYTIFTRQVQYVYKNPPEFIRADRFILLRTVEDACPYKQMFNITCFL